MNIKINSKPKTIKTLNKGGFVLCDDELYIYTGYHAAGINEGFNCINLKNGSLHHILEFEEIKPVKVINVELEEV